MAISQAMCTSFKVEILDGVHAFGAPPARPTTNADTFYIALYTSAATLDATTTAYTSTNEVIGAGYVAGGEQLAVSVVPTSSGTTAFLSFANVLWTSSTITARGAMIYNASQSNRAVAILDFGADKISSTGTFQINFPTAAVGTAIIQIA